MDDNSKVSCSAEVRIGASNGGSNINSHRGWNKYNMPNSVIDSCEIVATLVNFKEKFSFSWKIDTISVNRQYIVTRLWN